MSEAETNPHKLPRLALAILVLFPFAYGLLSLWMGQDANWDLRNYHWYNGYALVNHRFDFDLLPSQTPFFYNPLLDAAWYLFASHVPAWLASFTLSAIQGLNFILLFALARAVIDPVVRRRDALALLIAALGMLGGGWLAELGTVFYDNILSLGIFGSALAVIKINKALRWNQGKFWLFWVLAGIPIGLGTGIKLPAATFCVGLCGAILLWRAPVADRLARAFAFGIGVAIGMSATLGFWAWHLWVHYQNPLFPYFNNVFHSPLTDATSARDDQFIAPGWHKLIFPFTWTLNPLKVGEVPFRDIKLPLLYILLPLAVLARFIIRKPAPRLTTDGGSYLLWVLVIAYACWLLMFSIYRYAVPLEALAALGLFLALDRLPLAPRSKIASFIIVAVVSLATIQVANWGRTGFGDHFIEVKMPVIEDSANTMVLMAGFQPYSHVLSAFPPEMPVLRLVSNFASPQQDKAMNQVIRQRLADWHGKLALLLPWYDVNWISREVMPQFGLKTDIEACQDVTPNFLEPLKLCPISRQ